MDNMMSVEFLYRNKAYYALVRPKKVEHENGYAVTIMNGDLEILLYGHHVIVDEKHFIRTQQTIPDNAVAELRRCIAVALWQHIRENRLSDYKEHPESVYD